MRASLANAIIKAFDDIKHNIPDDAPDSLSCPLLVQFTLGDVRSLVRGVKTMRETLREPRTAAGSLD